MDTVYVVALLGLGWMVTMLLLVHASARNDQQAARLDKAEADKAKLVEENRQLHQALAHQLAGDNARTQVIQRDAA